MEGDRRRTCGFNTYLYGFPVQNTYHPERSGKVSSLASRPWGDPQQGRQYFIYKYENLGACAEN